MIRNRVILGCIALLAAVSGVVFASGSSASIPTTNIKATPTTLTLGPVISSLVVEPVCTDTPTIDLDPGLLASGPEVSTLQTLLQIPQDGVYGPQTATAAAGVHCPDLGLYAALQAVADETVALRDAAQARQAQIAVQRVSQPTRPLGQACADAAAIINQVWAGTGQEAHALNVVQKESGCTDTAYNPSGASGLFQLLGHEDMIAVICGPNGSAFDPTCNAKVALQLYSGSGWSPWAASGG